MCLTFKKRQLHWRRKIILLENGNKKAAIKRRTGPEKGKTAHHFVSFSIFIVAPIGGKVTSYLQKMFPFSEHNDFASFFFERSAMSLLCHLFPLPENAASPSQPARCPASDPLMTTTAFRTKKESENIAAIPEHGTDFQTRWTK